MANLPLPEHTNLNLPRVKLTADGYIDPNTLQLFVRVLNDWSRQLGVEIGDIEAFMRGVGWGGIGT